MRLSEIITIYLAAAAPVGVTYFLRGNAHARDARSAARAVLAALAWPLALVVGFVAGLVKRRAVRQPSRPAREDSGASVERRVEVCQRAAIDSLHRVEDALAEASGTEREKLRRAACAARESTERYAGLALLARAADADVETTNAAATTGAAELCRVAGRAGDDLEVAARCIQRRHVARLGAHHERARAGLIHALAELRETCGALRRAAETDESDAQRARRLSETLLEAFARAVELFSSLDDARSALAVARLLDAECARLRRLENAVHGDAPRASLEGENPCLPESSTSHPTPTASRSHIERLPQPTT